MKAIEYTQVIENENIILRKEVNILKEKLSKILQENDIRIIN